MTVKSVLIWILGILWLPVYLAYDLLVGSLRVGWELSLIHI